MMLRTKILIGSPVRQKPEILRQFLCGLDESETDAEVTYYFVDDNVEEESRILLKLFSETHQVVLRYGNSLVEQLLNGDYVTDDEGHHWKSENISRITCFKDAIIEYCIEKQFDYLFLVDSDIVLFKKTLQHLLDLNKEIVSEVFWTQWQPNKGLSPQCFWIPDLYKQDLTFNQSMDIERANKIRIEMNEKLRNPGVYQVDGLGACTLVARSAIEKGVRFKEIPNLSVKGEDRHFCIRAGVLGVDLFMDTTYPVYHIYREEYLSRVDEFKRDGFKFDMCQTYTNTPKEKTSKEALWNRIRKKMRRFLGRRK